MLTRSLIVVQALGLPRGAALPDIKQAFRREALRWHPDKNPGDEAAHAQFVAVGLAYNLLSDDARRAACDADWDDARGAFRLDLDVEAILRLFQAKRGGGGCRASCEALLF